MPIIFICINIFTILGMALAKQYDGITTTFIILNQNERGHIQRAGDLRDEILKFTPAHVTVEVLIATETFSQDAAWTFFPIMKKLDKLNSKWYVFIEEYTEIEVKRLLTYLSNYNHSKEQFIGKRLLDRQPTIIHHFDSFTGNKTLFYPDLRAGFVLSKAMVGRISSAWNYSSANMDFSIDASYELSKFIFSLGIKLQHSSYFCSQKNVNCILWSLELLSKGSVNPNSIFFAVKTCRKLAKERIPIIKDTWLSNAPRHQLYSDAEDRNLRTINIGIPNTENGHCSKTLEIIRQVSKTKNIKWLSIVDDDTLISVHRLASYLKYYSPLQKIALGERYGYMQAANKGYSYITGGGGIILSFPLVNRLSEAGACSCPTADSPDDMILGACLTRLNISLIHSRRFHQASADSYPIELLANSKPISFHKFWMIDPRESYNKWLHDINHDEL